ncbi:Uncharacterised protein [Vibrio cholerae]|nr:Uncharacterised protein [Vibrio cholerae]CSI50578.1 Uncharacterised protein [Vibrio cholerae]CSI75348.1 Uncharacterised protein [Vibrio cholerae]
MPPLGIGDSHLSLIGDALIFPAHMRSHDACSPF